MDSVFKREDVLIWYNGEVTRAFFSTISTISTIWQFLIKTHPHRILSDVTVLIKHRSYLAKYFFPIVYNKDKFSNREQSGTNRNDENAMCDYLPEY